MARLKKSEVKVILDKDSPSKREMLGAVARHLVQDQQTGLFISPDLDERCGGCGRVVIENDLVEYVGERFCRDCVEKWKAGGR